MLYIFYTRGGWLKDGLDAKFKLYLFKYTKTIINFWIFGLADTEIFAGGLVFALVKR